MECRDCILHINYTVANFSTGWLQFLFQIVFISTKVQLSSFPEIRAKMPSKTSPMILHLRQLKLSFELTVIFFRNMNSIVGKGLLYFVLDVKPLVVCTYCISA